MKESKKHKEITMIKLNGKIVQVADKDLPPGVTLPYRIKPGNIAVSLNLFFN